MLMPNKICYYLDNLVFGFNVITILNYKVEFKFKAKYNAYKSNTKHSNFLIQDHIRNFKQNRSNYNYFSNKNCIN